MSANEGASRPAPTPALTGAELARWYWTLAELTALARGMGLSAAGPKAALTARLAAALDGLEPGPEAAAASAASAGRRSGRGLSAPVDGATVIPPGQRCSQVLREFFVREIGPAFHFDAFMREYVARGAGRTLAEAVAHWHATRPEAARPQEIGAQFEFNRFLRDWHAARPWGHLPAVAGGSTRAEALAAWRARRARPRG
ncbi:DUF6434 domain-containing protein [Streptomyces subrutilus]|uniref:DUF6434 domain-containing protein n=1 Tax=Streptomyces subrutilus TaxID=36818 RepID=UPI0033F0FF7E